MSRFESVAQAVARVIRRARRCDVHRAAHLALAAVHTVIGALLAAGTGTPEAICVWLVALIYALLAKFGGHNA